MHSSCFRRHLSRGISILTVSRRALTTAKKGFSKTEFTADVVALDTNLTLIQEKMEERDIDIKLNALSSALDKTDIWDDPKIASETTKKHSYYSSLKSRFDSLLTLRRNSVDLASLAFNSSSPEDISLAEECHAEINEIFKTSKRLVAELLLDGPADSSNCLIEITAGAGGTESCDFSGMLLSMLTKLSQNLGFDISIIEKTHNEEAGIRSAVLKVSGDNAFGWLRSECGVHRLVRISPYDTHHRRQTCFSQVAVLPVPEASQSVGIALEIDKKRFKG